MMINSPVKFFSHSLVAFAMVAFGPYSIGYAYQSSAFQQDERPSVEERARLNEARVQSRSRSERRRVNLSKNKAPIVDRDAATTKPIDIKPGPYVPLGSIKKNIDDPVEGDLGKDEFQIDELKVNEDQDDDFQNLFSGFEVETGALNSIDHASTGLMDASEGGYSLNLWLGSNLENVIALLDKLTVGSYSPAQNRVARKLLLSTARVPTSNQDNKFDSNTQSVATESNVFLTSRLEKISQTGRLDDLLDFFELLPQGFKNSDIRQLQVDTALLDGDAMGACTIAEEARSEEGTAEWLKILTYCRALEGDRSGVSFNMSILEESGDVGELFSNLVEDVLSLAEGTIESDMLARQANFSLEDTLTPLIIAMVRTTGQELNVEALVNESVRNLAALTRRADLSNDFRAEIGKKAALRGALTSSDLASVYESLDYTEGERGSVYLLAETVDGARIDGLVFSLSIEEKNFSKKADLIKAAWDRAYNDGSYPVMAGVLSSSLTAISPRPEYAGLAHYAGRIYLLSQNIPQAKSWYEMVRGRAAQSDMDATKALIDLWPLMLVTDEDDDIPFGTEIIDLWVKSLESQTEDVRAQKASVFYGVLEALGYTVPEVYWDSVLNLGPQTISQMPSHVVWRKMALAQSQGLQGESVVLGLIALGEAGVAKADMSLVSSIISGLVRLGLKKDANALALEVLVAHGF